VAELRFTPEFVGNLESIAAYIAQDSEILAREFIKNLMDRLEVLKVNPEIGRVVPEKADAAIREIFYGSYRVVYRLAEAREIVDVVMIRHAARLR
jgi:toxin ParE1/3/4